MIVLDTHAWIWWITATARLSAIAQETIAKATIIGVSTLSAWEIAMLASRKRIALDRDVSVWVRQALAEPRVEPLPPSADIAVAAGLLNASFPGDQADRLIYATARANRAQLVTRDASIRAFDPQLTVW